MYSKFQKLMYKFCKQQSCFAEENEEYFSVKICILYSSSVYRHTRGHGATRECIINKKERLIVKLIVITYCLFVYLGKKRDLY